MKKRPSKIADTREAVMRVQLNAAERLRLAEALIEEVQVQLSPLHDPAMCVAEGMLRAALPAVEDAREHVEGFDGKDLPVAT